MAETTAAAPAATAATSDAGAAQAAITQTTQADPSGQANAAQAATVVEGTAAATTAAEPAKTEVEIKADPETIRQLTKASQAARKAEAKAKELEGKLADVTAKLTAAEGLKTRAERADALEAATKDVAKLVKLAQEAGIGFPDMVAAWSGDEPVNPKMAELEAKLAATAKALEDDKAAREAADKTAKEAAAAEALKRQGEATTAALREIVKANEKEWPLIAKSKVNGVPLLDIAIADAYAEAEKYVVKNNLGGKITEAQAADLVRQRLADIEKHRRAELDEAKKLLEPETATATVATVAAALTASRQLGRPREDLAAPAGGSGIGADVRSPLAPATVPKPVSSGGRRLGMAPSDGR